MELVSTSQRADGEWGPGSGRAHFDERNRSSGSGQHNATALDSSRRALIGGAAARTHGEISVAQLLLPSTLILLGTNSATCSGTCSGGRRSLEGEASYSWPENQPEDDVSLVRLLFSNCLT